MGFWTWLLGRTPDADTPPDDMPMPPIDLTPLARIEAADAAEVRPTGTRGEALLDWQQDQQARAIDLEDLFAIIEYESADGTATLRRITMRQLLPGTHAPIIAATCHERHAARNFRIDRIVELTTADGEILSLADFLRPVLGAGTDTLLALPRAEGAAPGPSFRRRPAPPAGNADRLRAAVKPGLALMVAAARADGRAVEAEWDAVEAWIENEASCLARDGEIPARPSNAEIGALAAAARRLRPQRDRIADAWQAVTRNWTTDPQTRLRRGRRAVIEADGILHDAEIAMLRELYEGDDG